MSAGSFNLGIRERLLGQRPAGEAAPKGLKLGAPLAAAETLRLGGFKRFVPETFILIGGMLLIDWLFFGGQRFADVQPHPFWIPVLLIAMQYGVGGAVFAALTASAALYIGALPERGDGVDFYTYVALLAGQPAAWLAVAVLLGGLRSLHVQRAASLVAHVAESDRRVSELGAGLSRALNEIKQLEQRIASDTSSVGAVLHGLARVDMTDEATLSQTLGDVIHESLGVAAYTLYLRRADGLEAIASVDEDGAAKTANRPPLRNASLMRTLDRPNAIVLRDGGEGQAMLPADIPMIVSIYSARTQQLRGALSLERMRMGATATQAELSAKARLLGSAIAALLDGKAPESFVTRKISEVRGDKLSA